MPLSKIQRQALRLLADHRNPESDVAGALPINREGPRFSADIDIFHDREESVALAANADAEILRGADFGVQWLRRERRVDEDVATLTPHSSERAALLHSVPHERASLTAV